MCQPHVRRLRRSKGAKSSRRDGGGFGSRWNAALDSDDLAGTCCATVWHSKGYADGNKFMANKIVERMWEWSDGGKIPVVCDASSCTFGITTEILTYLTLQNAERHKQLKLIDSVGWAYDHLLPKLKVERQVESAVIHPVCSIHHLGLVDKLQLLGEALAKKAVTPIYATLLRVCGRPRLSSSRADSFRDPRKRSMKSEISSLKNTCAAIAPASLA